jgi:putative inorganic carbon (hco3(-)) transporter
MCNDTVSSIDRPPLNVRSALRSDTADRKYRQTLAAGAVMALSFFLLVLFVEVFDAPRVLAAAIVVVAALPLLLWPQAATVLTAFLLYINFPAILTKQLGMPEIVAGSFILLLGLPLIHYLVLRRERLRVDSTWGWMLVFLLALLISSLGAIDKTIALGRVQGYLFEGVLLYLLVINSIRSMTTLRRVIWAALAAGSLVSALSLYQDATGSYTQEFGGLAYRNYVVAADSPDREGPARRETWDRAQGPVNEPNRFAQIMVVLLPLAVFTYRNGGSTAARLGAAAAGLLIFGGMLLTLSRGAFLTLVLIAAAMAAMRWVRTSHLLACAVVLLFAIPIVSPHFVPRMLSIVNVGDLIGGGPADAGAADGAMLGRTTVMLAALHTFLDHPAVGVGPGQFPPFYVAAYSDNPEIKFRDLRGASRRAHNLYLEMAAETGLIGLTTFLAIVLLLVRELWRARQRWLAADPERAELATAFCLSLLAYLTTAVFLHVSYQRYYWFLIAMAGATLHVLHARRLQDRSVPVQSMPRTRPGVRIAAIEK